ncbi:MAG: hypothetical protein H7287_08250 [Thermoleophilia bacterium]|nr:hypothetical protein [Thermoleophilia bacterium]
MTDLEASDDERAVRDVEEGLIAALQESDTAVEALQDSTQDAPRSARRTRHAVGAAGLLLALLALVVARRRS